MVEPIVLSMFLVWMPELHMTHFLKECAVWQMWPGMGDCGFDFGHVRFQVPGEVREYQGWWKAQAVKHLPSEYKALSSNPSTGRREEEVREYLKIMI
jgi:hypothetical protein